MPTYQQGVEKKIYNCLTYVPIFQSSTAGMVYNALSIRLNYTMNLIQPVRGILSEVTHQFKISLLSSTEKKKEWCS